MAQNFCHSQTPPKHAPGQNGKGNAQVLSRRRGLQKDQNLNRSLRRSDNGKKVPFEIVNLRRFIV